MRDAATAQPLVDAPLPLAVGNIGADPDATEIRARLPNDHPAWQVDTLSISSRTRAFLTTLRPVVVAVVSFWDHAVRTLSLGTGTLSVDLSGCYRFR
jgi:hypothetical protein